MNQLKTEIYVLKALQKCGKQSYTTDEKYFYFSPDGRCAVRCLRDGFRIRMDDVRQWDGLIDAFRIFDVIDSVLVESERIEKHGSFSYCLLDECYGIGKKEFDQIRKLSGGKTRLYYCKRKCVTGIYSESEKVIFAVLMCIDMRRIWECEANGSC